MYLPLVLVVPCGVRRTHGGLLIASAIAVQRRAALVAVLLAPAPCPSRDDLSDDHRRRLRVATPARFWRTRTRTALLPAGRPVRALLGPAVGYRNEEHQQLV